MIDFMLLILSGHWLANLPGASFAYALAALGLIISERAGVLNLTAEGLLLIGALAGIGATLSLGAPPVIALALAAVAGAAVSLLFALLTVVLRINQVIAGLATVFFCQGLTSLLGTLAGWQNRPITGLTHLDFGPLSALPMIGPILFSEDIVIYAAVPVFLLARFVLFRTMIGLRLRAVGENPAAADSAGISISLYRIAAILAGSALIGLAGGYLSVAGTKIWVPGMTSGRGWIAVALVIFARWRPGQALAGALLFGCIEALVPQIAAAGIAVPQYFMLMTPYVVTIGVMVWSGWTQGRKPSDEPGALGRPHVREERH